MTDENVAFLRTVERYLSAVVRMLGENEPACDALRTGAKALVLVGGERPGFVILEREAVIPLRRAGDVLAEEIADYLGDEG